MKKNLNIIQINGAKGLVLVVGIVVCLAVGFIWFPGWLGMHFWNYVSANFISIPQIGIIQGILLWGIIAASYYTFRKEKLVVCMRASDGLTEDELKKVFADIKQQAKMDPVLQNMLKAREAEFKIKQLKDINAKAPSEADTNDQDNVETLTK